MTKYLITSAIPSANGVKHLGNLIGSLLPADVHARFRRQCGDEVLFICGTDDHGTPVELSAEARAQDTATFCAEQHAIQADIYRRFGLSFDHFGRSSSRQNRELTQHFFRRLDAAGLIDERDVEQIWSPNDRRFLPDRYVLGRCPHCGASDARGDQCEACGAPLDPTDLLTPRSAISGATNLVRKPSKHLFLRQPDLLPQLRHWLATRKNWPPFVTALAQSWLTHDLRERCITRDLKWGVPVPRAGFENKVFYVWFDAPINYIAATQEWSEIDPIKRDWRAWWQQPDDVHYVQFLGKDNVPFHAVSFPATLLGSGETWKTVDVIKGFHWLTFEGGKFSTSQGRGIFTDAALEELPADFWRWWLIAHAPETSDTDFTVERFAKDVNKDLADVFGNLVHRSFSFVHRIFAGYVPDDGVPAEHEVALAAHVTELFKTIRYQHETLEFRQAAATTRRLWALGNSYFQAQAPWTVRDPARVAVILRTSLNLARLAAHVAWSIIPGIAHEVLTAFGETNLPRWPDSTQIASELDRRWLRPLPPSSPLAKKITEAKIAHLHSRFAGTKVTA